MKEYTGGRHRKLDTLFQMVHDLDRFSVHNNLPREDVAVAEILGVFGEKMDIMLNVLQFIYDDGRNGLYVHEYEGFVVDMDEYVEQIWEVMELFRLQENFGTAQTYAQCARIFPLRFNDLFLS
jgi:hypothetical protein